MLINLERARGLMKDFGIDLLIATTPENVYYTTDYAPWGHWIYRGNTPKKGSQSYAIVPRDESVSAAVIPQGSGYNTFTYAAEFPSWVEEYYPYVSPTNWPGEIPDVPKIAEPDTPPEVLRLRELTRKFKPRASKSPGEALVQALRNRGFERGVAALDTYGISPVAEAYLRRELPNLTLKDGCEFFRYLRAVKSADEIRNLRRSAEINEQAMQNLIAGIAAGRRIIDLAIEHRATCARAGAIPTFLNISAAQAVAMWEPVDYVLRPGEVVLMDGGCAYHHYHSDTGMSAVIGEPTARMKETFGAVQACMEAAISTCRPGATCSKIRDAMHATVKERGWAKPFAFGHGIGIEERDYPIVQGPFRDFDDEILTGSTDLPMETNMVLCLEVNFWEWGIGCIKAEQTVVVTPAGNETICRQERILTVKR